MKKHGVHAPTPNTITNCWLNVCVATYITQLNFDLISEPWHAAILGCIDFQYDCFFYVVQDGRHHLQYHHHHPQHIETHNYNMQSIFNTPAAHWHHAKYMKKHGVHAPTPSTIAHWHNNNMHETAMAPMPKSIHQLPTDTIQSTNKSNVDHAHTHSKPTWNTWENIENIDNIISEKHGVACTHP